MRQSTIIFGTIVFAFIVYITLRGQLAGYLSLFSKSGAVENIATDTVNTDKPASKAESVREQASNMGLLNGALDWTYDFVDYFDILGTYDPPK